MRTAAVAFVVSLAAASLLTPLVRRFAQRIGAIDHALSSRKVHKTPIPRLGGIAIVGAFFVPLIALLLVDSGVGSLFLAHRDEAIGLFVGGAIIAALGVYDDMKGSGAKLKFTVQFAVAAFAYKMGYRIDAVANPFGAPIQLGMFGLPFTMLWVAGVINAINLIDGLDGLAGGVAFIAVGTTFVAAVVHGEPVMALTTAALAGAILGFLRYNFNPASIFMGDTGSMFLGFVLATSAIQSHHKSSTAVVAILVPIVALGLPITDTLLAMARRYMRGAPLFQADREHIHHRLLARGLSHRRTVLVLYGASIVCGAVALLITSLSGVVAALALTAYVLMNGLLLYHLGYLRYERTAEVLVLRRRNLELRANVRDVADRLKHAAEVGDVWDTVKEALPTLGARSVALRVISANARGHQRTQHFTSHHEPAEELLRTQHTLLAERPDAGVLELGWGDGRANLDRDTELAVEMLCGHLHAALMRVGPIGPEAVNEPHRHVVAEDVRAWEVEAVGSRRVLARR
jgi:UDP-GlcNAc:undecaprenyl-phosphate GlcNAc-1-phosphate transferase